MRLPPFATESGLHEFGGLGDDTLQNRVILMLDRSTDTDNYGGLQVEAVIALVSI